MNIDIIAVGKVKESYLRDAIAEYSKRLSRYCKLNIIEVQDEKTPDHAGKGRSSTKKASAFSSMSSRIRM